MSERTQLEGASVDVFRRVRFGFKRTQLEGVRPAEADPADVMIAGDE